MQRGDAVAPRRGAWIETDRLEVVGFKAWESHPAGVRGLKLYLRALNVAGEYVAPRRGAWIETPGGV